MARYVQIDKRAPIKSGGDKLRRFLSRTFNGELFVGLWVVLKICLSAAARTRFGILWKICYAA